MLVMDLLFVENRTIPINLTQNETFLLEANLFVRLCDSLCDFFLTEYHGCYHKLKSTFMKEKKMIDRKLARCVVNDILSSGDYTITGIACYARAPEEVVYDIAAGRNPDPSSLLFRRIIKLHRTVRPELYQNIMKKLVIIDVKDE